MLQLAALLLTSLASGELHVDYTLRIEDPTERRVLGRAHVTGLSATATTLDVHMPERYAFIQFPEPLLEGPIEALAGDTSLEIERIEPYRWRIVTNGATAIDLRWRVPLTHRDVPEVKERDSYEHPYLAGDHGMLVCGAVFVTPRVADFDARVRFELPEDWPVLAPWPEVEPGSFAPASSRDLHDGLIALGAWRASEVSLGGARVRIAFAPSEAEFAPLAAPLVERIVSAELALFGTQPFDEFLILFTPCDVRGFAGSAKRGSMVLGFQHDLPKDVLTSHIGHLVAHEFFHTWASSRYDAPDELRFVNEGFTDYFAYLVLARAGVTSWTEFAQTLGQSLNKYEAGARATKLSLVDAGGPQFFASRDAYSQVYSGGLALAAACDAAIRAREGDADLATALRLFNNDARWDDRAARPALADFTAAIGQLAGEAFAADVERVIHAPLVDFVALLRARGCAIEAPPAPAPAATSYAIDPSPWRD